MSPSPPTIREPAAPGRWTAWSSIWSAIVCASLASLGVLWTLSWSGARDAVVVALSDQLISEAALVGEHLRNHPVDVLVGLGVGQASDAVSSDLARVAAVSGLHDIALLGPDGIVLGSGGTWLPLGADADLVQHARAGTAVVGPLYQTDDGAWYLAAYAPLVDRAGWVVAVEGSATLGAVDRLARRQAVASVVVVAVAALLGALLATFVARPLRVLETELQAVEPGDAPDRVVPSGPREVFRVAFAVRRLLAAIRDRDEAVASAHRRELDQVTRLAAEIAHEVRNPLNAMSLSTDRLARAEDPERREIIATRLRGQIEELEAIVGRLLDLTRPLAPSAAPIDTVRLVQRLAHDARVVVSYEGPESSVLSSDATLLGEVLRNLILNAEQAGATKVRVRIDHRTLWVLEIEDDGPGVSDPDHVFDWFHTTRARGSGLGLPVSRRIAEALGGQLSLRSARPAVFRLELPGGAS